MVVGIHPEVKLEIYEWKPGSPDPATRSLGEHEVHVWHGPLDSFAPELPQLQDLLSDDEKERAGRFHFEKNRAEYVLTRGRLRILLASYLSSSPLDLCFSYSTHGKPGLSKPAPAAGLSFNVSHTDGFAICAFARNRKIGIDVEHVRKNFDAEQIAERFFSVAERAALRNLPEERRHEAFFRCWTRKEAYIKAIGEGLSHPLHQFDVSLTADEPAALLGTRPHESEAGRWLLCDIPLPANYIAAVAVERDSRPAPQP
jgi:4'-phosphopantetheinyl transferase